MIDLSTATVTALPDIPMERLVTYTFVQRHDERAFDLALVEPKDPADFLKHGWWIEQNELTEKGGDVISTTYIHVESLPQIILAAFECWRMDIRHTRAQRQPMDLQAILQPLIDAGIAEEVPDEALPEGVGAVFMRPKPEENLPPTKDQALWRKRGWKLQDLKSGLEVAFGDVVLDDDGDSWELIGGYPPQVPGSTGRIFVNDQDGCEREFFPSVVGLTWNGDATEI